MGEDNLYATLKPVNYLCMIFGVASYSISDIKNYDIKEGTKIWKRLWPFVLTLLLTCGYIYRTGYIFIVESHLVHHNLLVTDILTTSMEYTSGIVLILFRAVNHPKNVSLLFKKFSLLSGCIFESRNEFGTQKLISPVIIISLWMIISFYILFRCLNMIIWNTHWTPALIFGENWCSCASYLVIVKYVFLVQYYMKKHRKLNYQIRALSDLSSHNIGTLISNGCSSNTRPNHPSEATAGAKSPSPDAMLLNRVVALKEHHMHLYDVSQLLNSTYGFQILLCICLLFVDHILRYNFVIDLMYKAISRKDGIATDMQEYSSLCLALTSSAALIFLTISCHLASEEANSSQQLVHKLLLKPDMNRDLIVQLQLFSSQVSNLKVKFTTCGFFTINASLLYGTAGVVCTYLIILHQFR